MRLNIPLTIAGTVVLFLLGFAFLGGCSLGAFSQIEGTPTITGLPPSPTSRVLNAIELAAENQLHVAETQQAEDLIAGRVSGRLTATAEGTARAEQARIDQLTAKAQERSDRSTEQAYADNLALTKQAWGVTVTAAVASTQTAFPMTETARPMYGTAEAGSLHARGTQEAGSAELIYLTVQRQQMKNPLDAYMPSILILSALAIGVISVFIFSQYRQLKRDRNGLLGAEAIKHANGVTFIKPDLMTAPAITVNKLGQVTEVGAETEFQQQTTRRQQLVEAGKGKTMQEFRQLVNLLGPSGASSESVNYFDANHVFEKILGEAEEDLVDGEVTDV
jgi:hypothetical protein